MTERERERRARHRLAIIRHAQEVTNNVAKTCRYYGITRTAYYEWLRRYEAGGFEALKVGSSRPHHSPTTTQAEVVGRSQAKGSEFSGDQHASRQEWRVWSDRDLSGVIP